MRRYNTLLCPGCSRDTVQRCVGARLVVCASPSPVWGDNITPVVWDKAVCLCAYMWFS